MTGSRAQLYNGLLLLFTFFSARLVYGTYQSYQVFSDIWALLGSSPDLTVASDTLRFATAATTAPTWLGFAYLSSNLVLNFLNFYWFFMMIRAVRKRFVPASEKPQAVAAASADAVSTAQISAESPAAANKPRRRKA